MTELLKDEDLKNRKFFHKPVGADGRVLPHASFVKEFLDDDKKVGNAPVRLAHGGFNGSR